MIKKTIKYMDLDGKEVVDDFYFHLTSMDLAELRLKFEGGLAGLIDQIRKAGDMVSQLQLLKEFIGSLVGRRSEDGKSFIKTPEIRDAFLGSEAFGALFEDIHKDENSLVQFLIGALPAEAQKRFTPEQLMAQMKAVENAASLEEALKADMVKPEEPKPLPQAPETEAAAKKMPPRISDLTTEQVATMSDEDFNNLMKRLPDPNNIPRHILVGAFQRQGRK